MSHDETILDTAHSFKACTFTIISATDFAIHDQSAALNTKNGHIIRATMVNSLSFKRLPFTLKNYPLELLITN